MSTAGRGHGEDMKKTGQVIFLRVISDIAFFTGVHEIHGNLLEKEGKIMCQHVCLFVFFFPKKWSIIITNHATVKGWEKNLISIYSEMLTDKYNDKGLDWRASQPFSSYCWYVGVWSSLFFGSLYSTFHLMTGKKNLFFINAFVKLSVDLTPAANRNSS